MVVVCRYPPNVHKALDGVGFIANHLASADDSRRVFVLSCCQIIRYNTMWEMFRSNVRTVRRGEARIYCLGGGYSPDSCERGSASL